MGIEGAVDPLDVITAGIELPRAVWELKAFLSGLFVDFVKLNSHAQYGN